MEQEQKAPASAKKLTFVQKFILFIRTQGVIGLAVAVVLGGAVQKVVTALVNDILNPIIGLFLGKSADLKDAAVTIGNAKILWGDFVSTIIDFLIIALVIYLIIKVLNAGMLDKQKQ
ncbi:MAG TPA: large conductance mechanosensitive channel protein MscL [Candidatus Paceibacterota bacterium]|nr:large conductance mechanosensitive channel protein MscL [Candidatus Paceibacterota bacterium]